MAASQDKPGDTSEAAATSRAPERKRQSVRSRRVFISSTSLDLKEHRKRLHDDLERMNLFPVDMSGFGAGGADATTVSYRELATADIVVLIVAWRYGFVPEGEARSITELEYEEARRLGLPIYIYLADPATEADDGPNALFPAETRQPEYAAQVAAFRARLSDPNANTRDTFNIPADLSAKVLAALGREPLRYEQAGRHALIEAQKLDRTRFKLGDDDAATFTYLTEPVREAWEAATQALRNATVGVGSKQGILALGEANVGKTRLALEALIQTMPDWPVLRWSEAFTSADLPPAGSLPDDRLVLFIDDLQNYALLPHRGSDGQEVALSSGPAATLRALVESISSRSLVIVATCRVEDEGRTRAELGWLFTKLAPVRVPQFSADAEDVEMQPIVADFAAHGAAHVEDWDGTLGSLVLGLSAKHAQYETLVKRHSLAVTVLHAMKLLAKAKVFTHTARRLRAVCAEILHQKAIKQDEHVWEAAYKELLRLQFVRIASNLDEEDGDDAGDMALVIRKDVYFDTDKVVAQYPDPYDPEELTRHLIALQVVFVALEDADGLVSLGGVFIDSAEYRRALSTFEFAVTIQPKTPVTWVGKAEALEMLDRVEESLVAYEQALALRPSDAALWYHRGRVLCRLERYKEALVAFGHHLTLTPESVPGWLLKGCALTELHCYEDALAAYAQALVLHPDSATAWYLRGLALARSDSWGEALGAFSHALALSDRYVAAWLNKGLALEQLGRSQEAVEAYERVLALQPDDVWARRGMAQALQALGRGSGRNALADDGG